MKLNYQTKYNHAFHSDRPNSGRHVKANCYEAIMLNKEEAFWQYWKKRWPHALCNEKTLKLSANFRETRKAFFAGFETAQPHSSKTNETRLIFDSWMCSFCGETYVDKNLAIKHALGCDNNEDVHSCATCALYEIGEDSQGGYRHICKGNVDRIDTWMKHCPEWIEK